MSNQAKYPKPVVGQAVWVERKERFGTRGKEETVIKVGRRWAEISGPHGSRFDIETWRLDGGKYTSPGNVYPSLETRSKEVSLMAAWHNFSSAIDRYSAPPNVTIEAIQQAADLLGLELNP